MKYLILLSCMKVHISKYISLDRHVYTTVHPFSFSTDCWRNLDSLLTVNYMSWDEWDNCFILFWDDVSLRYIPLLFVIFHGEDKYLEIFFLGSQTIRTHCELYSLWWFKSNFDSSKVVVYSIQIHITPSA